ncbi:predicted protein [Lichtheimia corymbifera JMRC:FSU:9682]|uniref:Uncharacterized protein n=1 Tax=Lichtheimia corymbifera JMRC:FSU:9682 TaxID=1263082 RepID=A0A068SES0_9FUNG|nr:predicted protein [Lichtheimia corymbifera JMRC:FSU:9682]
MVTGADLARLGSWRLQHVGIRRRIARYRSTFPQDNLFYDPIGSCLPLLVSMSLWCMTLDGAVACTAVDQAWMDGWCLLSHEVYLDGGRFGYAWSSGLLSGTIHWGPMHVGSRQDG